MKRKIYGKNPNVINEINLNEITYADTEDEKVESEASTENIATSNITPIIQPNVTEEELNSDYVGSEEQEITNSEQVEEKVIELVKNEYGTNEGVNFTIANKEGNIYHVSVIDSNTTAVLAWYNVDIETNTVVQQ